MWCKAQRIYGETVIVSSEKDYNLIEIKLKY